MRDGRETPSLSSFEFWKSKQEKSKNKTTLRKSKHETAKSKFRKSNHEKAKSKTTLRLYRYMAQVLSFGNRSHLRRRYRMELVPNLCFDLQKRRDGKRKRREEMAGRHRACHALSFGNWTREMEETNRTKKLKSKTIRTKKLSRKQTERRNLNRTKNEIRQVRNAKTKKLKVESK